MEIRKLASIANKLDSLGLTKEADVIDRYIKKVALDLPNTDIESLPDSPDEAAAYRASRPQPMMAGVTYGPDGKPMRGGLQMATPEKKEKYVATPSSIPQTPAGKPTAAEKADAVSRKQISQQMGKGVTWKPQDLIKEYNFNFTPTMGKTGNIAQIQTALNGCGFDAGTVDGYWGGKTDAAFKDAITAFARIQPADLNYDYAMVVNSIADGGTPTSPFSLDLVFKACDHIKKVRASGGRVPQGRSIQEYAGSKGGGQFRQMNTRDDAKLVSTKAGDPKAGTPVKR